MASASAFARAEARASAIAEAKAEADSYAFAEATSFSTGMSASGNNLAGGTSISVHGKNIREFMATLSASVSSFSLATTNTSAIVDTFTDTSATTFTAAR